MQKCPDTVYVSERTAFRTGSSIATAPAEDPVFAGPAVPPEDLTLESARLPEPDEPEPQWKQEIASRLESYRARRGSRRPRYNPTRALDFERATTRMITSARAEEGIEVEQQAPAPSDPEPMRLEERNEYFGAAVEPDAWEQPTPAPVPITKENLKTVIDAKWITKDELCAGVDAAKAPAGCK